MGVCEINVVIGSWGSYNACNERALGSGWLNLSDYSEWEEIEEELIKRGFELVGIDEELFVQDIEGIDSNENWDYVNPERLFNVLKEADVLDNLYKYDKMCAYLDVRSFSDFESLVDSRGYRWDEDIHVYKGYDYEDYGREMFEMCGYQIPESIEDFIDFEAYGRYVGEYVEEYDGGLIEIY